MPKTFMPSPAICCLSVEAFDMRPMSNITAQGNLELVGKTCSTALHRAAIGQRKCTIDLAIKQAFFCKEYLAGNSQIRIVVRGRGRSRMVRVNCTKSKALNANAFILETRTAFLSALIRGHLCMIRNARVVLRNINS